MNRSFVLKLGGSLIYDSELKLNHTFFTKFLHWIDKAKDKYDHIVIVVGGGTVARHLINQVKPYAHSDKELHQIGMHVTLTNALMLSSLISDKNLSVPMTLGQALEDLIADNRRIVITGGFKVGWSTDMDAAVLADVIGAKKVYKLSNIDHIYSADPKKVPDARIYKELTWREYNLQFGINDTTIGDKPGFHVPIGSYASQFASRKGLSFFLSGGKTLDQVDDLDLIFESGTYVHP